VVFPLLEGVPQSFVEVDKGLTAAYGDPPTDPREFVQLRLEHVGVHAEPEIKEAVSERCELVRWSARHDFRSVLGSSR
jgi:hypothetical protein